MFTFTRRSFGLMFGTLPVLVLITMLGVSAFAQSVTGSISGSVTDLTGEKRSLQLRWGIYNLFNHTNFKDLDGALTFGLVQVNPNPGLPVR